MRILHTADNHLGVTRYAKIDSLTGLNARGLDFLTAFQHVADLALTEKVDVLLMVGDLFNRLNPHPRYILEVIRKLKQVAAAGITSIIVSGNHETPRMATSLNPLQFLGELEGVHVAVEPTTVTVGEYDFVCVPAPPNFDEIHNLFEPLLAAALRQARSEKKVLAAHLPLGQAVTSSEMTLETFVGEQVDVAQIPTMFEYVALGHMHRFQRVPHPRMPVYYAGSSERYEFGEEHDDKYAVMVEFGDEPSVTPVKLPARKMATIADADCSGMSAAQITRLVLAAIDREQGSLTDALVRVKLENVDFNQNRLIDRKEIAIRLADEGVFEYEFLPRTKVSLPVSAALGDQYILPPSQELALYLKSKNKYRDRTRLLLRLGSQLINEAREVVAAEA